MAISLDSDQVASFHRDGFLTLDRIISSAQIAPLRERFERLFSGQFETGIEPDEVNWQLGESDPTLTRQICNGWKADSVIAATVLGAGVAKIIAGLAGWPGARLIQDNLLWKPPGARSLGFHRDNAYLAWYTPREMFTCWIALDETRATGGTVEYARGSHRWSTADDPESTFHAPDDYRAAVSEAALAERALLDIEPVEVPPGGGTLHHGWLWHGSGANTTDSDRRALVIHLASSEARFDRSGFDEGTGPIYARYAPDHGNVMSDDDFPILWTAAVP